MKVYASLKTVKQKKRVRKLGASGSGASPVLQGAFDSEASVWGGGGYFKPSLGGSLGPGPVETSGAVSAGYQMVEPEGVITHGGSGFVPSSGPDISPEPYAPSLGGAGSFVPGMPLLPTFPFHPNPEPIVTGGGGIDVIEWVPGITIPDPGALIGGILTPVTTSTGTGKCLPATQRSSDWVEVVEEVDGKRIRRSFSDHHGASNWIKNNKSRFPDHELKCFQRGSVFDVYKRSLPPKKPVPGTQPGTGTVTQPGTGTGTVTQPGTGTGTVTKPGTGTTTKPGTGTTTKPGTGTTTKPGTGTTTKPGTGTTTKPASGNITLTSSVGVGGINDPADLLAVQQRLAKLGYLSASGLAAESKLIKAAQAPTASPPDIRTLPQTFDALARFSSAAIGRPVLLIAPGSAILNLLNAPLPVPLGKVKISEEVGKGGKNLKADVRQIQDRLLAIKLLSASDYGTEKASQKAYSSSKSIPEAKLPKTIASLTGFNLEAAGITLHKIRPNSREERFLNNPPRFKTHRFKIVSGVGTGLPNFVGEVKLIQDRLKALGNLSAAHYKAEVVDPTKVIPSRKFPDSKLTHTLAAIRSFQTTMGKSASGQVTNGSETLRLLIRPNLPPSRKVSLSGAVGIGKRTKINHPADVRHVQDRLFELGFLKTRDYLKELSDPKGKTSLKANKIPATITAIKTFQKIVVGSMDGTIDPGGKSNRVLNDPTYGTLTSFNPEAANATAGISFSNQNKALNKIIKAIEKKESGKRTGEAPADLINPSGTPASYGAAQNIGANALTILRKRANKALRIHYGLSTTLLNQMNNRAASTRIKYNSIYTLVAKTGVTESKLNTLIKKYIKNQGPSFRTKTGLSNKDIENMFRAAQIRRRILAAVAPLKLKSSATAPSKKQFKTLVAKLLSNSDFRSSYDAIGMNKSSLRAYIRNRRNMGEFKQGFITKSTLSGAGSQQLRNAMTDASGRAMGRMSIRSLFVIADGLVAKKAKDREKEVAARTARGHNSGSSKVNDSKTIIFKDPYVKGVLKYWNKM